MVPAFLTVILQLCPGWIKPESKLPSSAVTVWAKMSSFFHSTVSPCRTVICAGWKLTFFMITCAVEEEDVGCAGDAAGVCRKKAGPAPAPAGRGCATEAVAAMNNSETANFCRTCHALEGNAMAFS